MAKVILDEGTKTGHDVVVYMTKDEAYALRNVLGRSYTNKEHRKHKEFKEFDSHITPAEIELIIGEDKTTGDTLWDGLYEIFPVCGVTW